MRLFFALPGPPEAVALVARIRKELDEGRPGIDWLPDESLHLTLSFLGELGKPGFEAALRALRALREIEAEPEAPRFAPLDLGFFPERGRPRVFALKGSGDAQDGLLSLRTVLCGALAREAKRAGLSPLDADWPDADFAGSRPRRPFSPHLSLARVRDRAKSPFFDADSLDTAREAIRRAPAFALDRLILFESRPSRSGPRYIPVETLLFKGKESGH